MGGIGRAKARQEDAIQEGVRYPQGNAGISDQEAEGAEIERRTGIDYGRRPFAQGHGRFDEGRENGGRTGKLRYVVGRGSQLGRVPGRVLYAAFPGAIGFSRGRDGIRFRAARMGRLGTPREQGNQAMADARVRLATCEGLGDEENRGQQQSRRSQESTSTQVPHTPNIPQAAPGT